MNPKVLVIIGTTAVGKSSLAIKLARKWNGEIISADSRQVYRGLDIGTGKVTKKEMQGIPHHLINVVDPKKKFTVTEYQKLASKKLEEIISRGNIPIIVGGTGFYIDAIIKGIIFPEVKPNMKLRKTLDKLSAIELFKILKKLDKNRATNIDAKNKVRLIRAIEIAQTLGKVPQITRENPPYNFIKIGLKADDGILRKKIGKRVKQMFKDGLINEIKKLKKTGVSEKRLREFGFEYNSPTLEKVILETIQYAKRQNTYFKRDKEIKWFNPEEYSKIEKYIRKLLKV